MKVESRKQTESELRVDRTVAGFDNSLRQVTPKRDPRGVVDRFTSQSDMNITDDS